MKTVSYDDMLTSFSYKSLLAVLLASMTTLSQAEQPHPKPTQEQIELISQGDFEELKNYLGVKNTALKVEVSKIVFTPIENHSDKQWVMTLHGKIIASNDNEAHVGMTVQWVEYCEIGSTKEINFSVGTYYCVNPVIDKVNYQSNEIILKGGTCCYFPIARSHRLRSISGVLPPIK